MRAKAKPGLLFDSDDPALDTNGGTEGYSLQDVNGVNYLRNTN